MTKCKIKISTNRSFMDQEEARKYLKKLVEAGILFLHCFVDGEQTTVKANETSYYQTQRDAKIDLKKYIDAGILHLRVQGDDR